MTNLKNMILQALQGSKKIESTLNDLTISQDNLLKNYSNPVFSSRDKNKILMQYTNLQDIGKSLYRYNAMKENNYITDAEEEKIVLENGILKGGISYNKYVWHAENGEDTCDVCKLLDGKVFDFYDEVPERPHPNCRCTVEIVEDYNKESSAPENKKEHCDMLERLDVLINELETANDFINEYLEDIKADVQDLENDLVRVKSIMQEVDSLLEILGEEYRKHFPACENNIDSDYEHLNNLKTSLGVLLNDIKQLLEKGLANTGTFIIFASNYVALLFRAYVLKQYEMDKYYHSKANCEATQIFGELGEEAAILLSNTKEKFDQWNNVYAKSHKVTIEEAIADSERDQIANRLGRERGRMFPNCKCYNLMRDLLPDYKK